MDASDFATKAKIMDKNVKFDTVDRAFISANYVDDKKLPQSQGAVLCRFQFWELLLRLAA